MRSMINIQFENQPVVGVYKVEPLWHLYLARPGNVQCCSARIDRVAHIDRINLHLEEAMVDSCWLTSLTETDGRECHSDYGGESKSI